MFVVRRATSPYVFHEYMYEAQDTRKLKFRDGENPIESLPLCSLMGILQKTQKKNTKKRGEPKIRKVGCGP